MTQKTPCDRWALVLGASCGTGGAIARALARDPGMHVFGIHRGNHPSEADRVKEAVLATGHEIHFRIGDAGTLEGVLGGVEEIQSVAGPRSIGIVVHSLANASVGRLASREADQITPRQVHKTFDSMAHSFLFWTQELFKRNLLAPGAHILGLTNWMTDSVLPGTALIAATKEVLGVYTRHLARELGPHGYRVNLLKFGGVFTPAVEKTFGEARLERLRRVLSRLATSHSISTVDEVAHFVSVLAGDASSRFNGATIDFTGGESQGFFDVIMNASCDCDDDE
ncbi:MAG: SDR family oxidoreductase [Polyangiaceae bacterium]|nr:SDR family oxidoreductase [Polyangiaceae bacterium]